MIRLPRALAATLAFAALSSAHAQSTPKTGTEVLQRMHDAYAGKWYHTLAFVQQTTAYRGAAPTVTTWYEALRHTDKHGTQLRIDVGEPAAGNGMLYTADSMWRMRDGKLAAQSDQGNEFLPMIEGVYVQPIAKTLEQIKGFGVDMSKVSTGKWQDRPVWIVGAAAAADSTSPQFWIDTDRKVVVRMLMNSGATGSALMDIRLDGYVPVGGGWLATKIAMLVGGKPRQTEVYSQWKANIDLAPGLFDPATWTTTPHWAAKP